MERKLEEIRNVQAQTEALNNQLRAQIQTNAQLKEACEGEKSALAITLNTIRGEKQAADSIVAQLRQDLQRFGNSQNSSQTVIITENTNLKSQLAVVSQ